MRTNKTKTSVPVLISKNSDLLYHGTYESIEEKKILINIKEVTLSIDLKKIIENDNSIISTLQLHEITAISTLLGVKTIVYPNNNFSVRKLDSTDDELKTCFIGKVNNSNNIFICLAFEETQPFVYKAELIGVFELLKDLETI